MAANNCPPSLRAKILKGEFRAATVRYARRRRTAPPTKEDLSDQAALIGEQIRADNERIDRELRAKAEQIAAEIRQDAERERSRLEQDRELRRRLRHMAGIYDGV